MLWTYEALQILQKTRSIIAILRDPLRELRIAKSKLMTRKIKKNLKIEQLLCKTAKVKSIL